MNLQVGVKALIRDSNGNYLFLRRSTKLFADSDEVTWDIPGGRINPEENLLDALKREVKEEIGHNIQTMPRLIAAQDIFVQEKELHVVRLTYFLEESIEEVHVSDEHSEYKWVSGADIKFINAEPILTEVLTSL